MRLRTVVVRLIAVGAGAGAGPASAAELLRTDVTAGGAVEPWSGSVTFGAGAPNEETWTLSCEQPEGTIRSARQGFVERGQRRSLDLRRHCKIRR
jgi:hypothetical protein